MNQQRLLAVDERLVIHHRVVLLIGHLFAGALRERAFGRSNGVEGAQQDDIIDADGLRFFACTLYVRVRVL